MKFARSIAAAALLLVVAACAYIQPLQPPATYYVMRHLHTAPGEADPGLTPEGQRQAQLLAESFPGTPPVTIFVSNTRRARETAAPLAARLGITPVVYNPADTQTLMLEVMKEPPPVLIVGHSNTVPDIVAALGGARPAPLDHTDFGDLWTISGPRRTVKRTRIGG